MSAEKVPYITRLELQNEKLKTAIKLVMEYNKAVEFVGITGYKAEAQKKADALKHKMKSAIDEALNTQGG